MCCSLSKCCRVHVNPSGLQISSDFYNVWFSGAMALLRPLLLDVESEIQQTAALALGRLANYNEDLAEAVVKGDILPQLVYSLAEQNVIASINTAERGRGGGSRLNIQIFLRILTTLHSRFGFFFNHFMRNFNFIVVAVSFPVFFSIMIIYSQLHLKIISAKLFVS